MWGEGRDLEEGARLFSLMAPEPKWSSCETEKRCLPLGRANDAGSIPGAEGCGRESGADCWIGQVLRGKPGISQIISSL